ncbi:hypothetical protein JDV02_009310 [Purpureocillium takamizusanense]|uniref:Uncharacterized protein n=1 Tax=Purpureocillium takamizusanense TaxID=2060973 RepID=A0A9Q8VG54_9HYPO|nr:uncharacterized protein JDV02_009310 [Purpureocillium takamizusanense]UNI23492.1 hypothetical protein JDV02_009310 [Purpureocillium takamizusanense]
MAHQHQQAAAAGEWSHSLFDCSPCSLCLLGCCLPCIPFGRSIERMKDPSQEKPDMVNTECVLFGLIELFTGCACVYNLLRRGEMRQTYGIKGNGCTDCLTSCCCLCCAVIQQEKESQVRAPLMRQPITQGYQGQKEGMTMPAPAYHQQQHQPMEHGQQPIQPVQQPYPHEGYPSKQ